MGSEQGALATAPPSLKRALPDATPTILTTSDQGTDESSQRSLKRSRPHTSPNNTGLHTIGDAGLTVSPLAKSPGFSPRLSPAPLTGAAAMEDQRRQREEQERQQGRAMSENPGHRALSSLISGASAEMSKPQDAPPAATTMSDGLSVVAKTLNIPSPLQFEDKAETSPASVTSLASLNSTAPTATASTAGMASPSNAIAQPNDWDRRDNGQESQDGLSFGNKSAARADTFPGHLMSRPENAREQQVRGMSLPMVQPRSPSKANKCPHCDAQFTRQHNLKSHLLTHSQEKPFVCDSCNMRFRRLHDLKRHSKLHTGERPHICPKCDRKFARGDALARHAKGQGGCAGRRASMGSFGGDDDYDESHIGDESGMDGVMFTEGGEHGGDATMDDDDRRYSLPSIKASHVEPHGQANYAPQPRPNNTYPPPGHRQRQPTGPNYQPVADQLNVAATMGMQVGGNSNHSIRQGMPTAGAQTSHPAFSPMQITESPKPLSPGMVAQQGPSDGSINRQRSPSLATALQQQNFGRRQQSERVQSPQGMPLPSPLGPKLPSLSGLAPPEPRYTLPSQATNQQPTTNGSQPAQQGQQSQQSSGSSFQPQMSQPPHHQQTGSGDSSNSANLFASEKNVWTYVNDLENQVRHLSDRLENNEREKEEKIRHLNEKAAAMEQILKQQQMQIQQLQQQVRGQGQQQHQQQQQQQQHQQFGHMQQ